MARNPKATTKPEGAPAIAERLQSILVNAAEGRRSVADDREFSELRRKLARTVPKLPNFYRPILLSIPSVPILKASVAEPIEWIRFVDSSPRFWTSLKRGQAPKSNQADGQVLRAVSFVFER